MMPLIKGCSKRSRKKNFHELKVANEKRVKQGLKPRSIKQRVAIVLSTERKAGCRKPGMSSGRWRPGDRPKPWLTKHLHGAPGRTLCGERWYEDTGVRSVKDTNCYYCKLAWEKAFAAGRSAGRAKKTRWPSIEEVARELRGINKAYDSAGRPGDEDDSIDVRLQVYEDGAWAVRWGLSDYDQDHRGYWGASSVPGSNRRFDSKATARDLIAQAQEQEAMG